MVMGSRCHPEELKGRAETCSPARLAGLILREGDGPRCHPEEFNGRGGTCTPANLAGLILQDDAGLPMTS